MAGLAHHNKTNRSFSFSGSDLSLLISSSESNGQFALLRVGTPAGSWTPPHLHQREDELVYVLSGALTARTPTGSIELTSGETLLLPRGIPHQLGNHAAEPAESLLLCSPGGFDDFLAMVTQPEGEASPEIDEASEYQERVLRIAARFGIELRQRVD